MAVDKERFPAACEYSEMDSGTQRIFPELLFLPKMLAVVDTKLKWKQVLPSVSSECGARRPRSTWLHGS